MNDPNYSIKIVPCLTGTNKNDHAFMGKTYQENLKETIQKIRKKYGFYEIKKR